MSGQAKSPHHSLVPLFVATMAISLSIILVGGGAIYLFYERLGELSREEQRRRVAAAMPQAVRPPSRDQVLLLVSTDGHTLTPRLEELRGESIPRTEQLTLVVDKVLRTMAEERGTALPFTLRAVHEAGSIAYVDLAPEPEAEALDLRGEALMAYAIVGSIVDNFAGVGSVQFLVNGEMAQTLASALDISAPLVPNAALRRSN